MPEQIPQTPPSFDIRDGAKVSWEDKPLALASLVGLELFLQADPDDPSVHSSEFDDTKAGVVSNVSDALVSTGLWRELVFDSETRIAIDTNPDHAAARLQWLQEGWSTRPSAEREKYALLRMVELTVCTFVERALSYRLQ